MCESCCAGRPTPGRRGTANGVKGASSVQPEVTLFRYTGEVFTRPPYLGRLEPLVSKCWPGESHSAFYWSFSLFMVICANTSIFPLSSDVLMVLWKCSRVMSRHNLDPW